MADPVNDVNVEAMRELDKKIRENPVLAQRTLKVRASWQRGTKAIVEVGEHEAGGARVTPKTRKFIVTNDAPPGLGGADNGPAAVEVMLAAVAGCITSGIATNAALFDVPIDGLDVEMDAKLDLRGVFGHDKSIRNGISEVHYKVTVHSSAPEEKLRRCKETIDRKSPVLDSLAKGVKFSSEFAYKPR